MPLGRKALGNKELELELDIRTPENYVRAFVHDVFSSIKLVRKIGPKYSPFITRKHATNADRICVFM